jgi:hypothetical protein
VVKRKIPSPYRQSNPPILQLVARRYTTELTGSEQIKFGERFVPFSSESFVSHLFLNFVKIEIMLIILIIL